MRQGSNVRRGRGRPNRKQHVPLKSQTFDSAGPDVRVRGNAHQVFERYISMARDATASGDRISAENFYQHAEHYYRIMSETTDPQSNGQGGHHRQRGNGRSQGDNRNQAQNGEAPAAGDNAGTKASPEKASQPEETPSDVAEKAAAKVGDSEDEPKAS